MTNELSAEFRADHLLVLYASQTGNAGMLLREYIHTYIHYVNSYRCITHTEWIAKNIDKEAKLRGFQSDCLVMDQAFEKVNCTSICTKYIHVHAHRYQSYSRNRC
jgi:hypothetical protein